MKIVLVVIIVCCLPAVVFGQGKTSDVSSAAGRELLGLVTKWNDAELKGDAATIANLLADEFSILGGSTRSEYLALMKPDPTLIIEYANIEKPLVHLYGDAAVVTTLNVFKLTKSGQPFSGRFLSMTVWIKRGGRWQCVNASMQEAKD
jgi:hypothetical protein